jgi:hypothetical protein
VSYNIFFYIFWIIFQWRNVMCNEVISLNFYNYFSMEKYDIAWDDVACSLNFQIYFFNKEMWCGMSWGMLLESSELFFNGERWCDMRWFLELLKLFFNRERWHDIRWCDMLFEFLEIFFNGEKWHVMRWCDILTCWEN